MNSKGTGATFREQSTWATLVTTVIVYVALLFAVLYDPGNAWRTAWLLGAAVVVEIGVLVLAHIVLAIRAREEPDDERDAAVALRSLRYSHVVLGAGIVLSILGLLAGQILRSREDALPVAILDPLWIGHWLVFCLVLSEIARLVSRVIGYRRGA